MLDDRLREFLDEDSTGWRDVSSSVVEGDARARVVTKENGVVAGLDEASRLLGLLDSGVEIETGFDDGEEIDEGDTVLEAEGDAASLLRGERPCLNILGSMSGIATVTADCVEKAGEVTVAATRKTTPGYRSFEKKAVRVGGGDPHRYSLDDAVMLKENHIELEGLETAFERARDTKSFTSKIEVEAETVETAVEAAELGADIVLLDNMSPSEVENCVDELGSYDVVVEASGGITPENVGEYAGTGVDVVSMGSLIHSSDWLDYSMRIEK
ncbi:carboxylating nicotinate-nucleotide diphosphorylase [Halorutilales archaeon Cl-col2-1]